MIESTLTPTVSVFFTTPITDSLRPSPSILKDHSKQL